MAAEQPTSVPPPVAAAAPPPDTLHRALESYSWHTDREFQSGLQAILGPSSSSSDQTQINDLTLRARCFYYSRKYNTHIDFDAYKAWRERQAPSSLSALEPVSLPPPSLDSNPSSAENTPNKPAASGAGGVNGAAALAGSAGAPSTQPQQAVAGEAQDDNGQPAYPPSFATIMELIKTGQPIPGIKEIPDTVLEDQATEATKSRRKKPWEERQDTGDVDAIGGAGAYGGYFGPPAAEGESSTSSLFSSARAS